MMAFMVICRSWHWPLWAALALIAPFLLIDLTFLGANLLKVVEGGWMPLALGALVMVVMYTWRRGSRLLFDKTRKTEMPLDPLVATLERKPPHARAGHRGVPDQRSDLRADRDDAQPQALQGAAREERHPDHRDAPVRRASTRPNACRSSRSARLLAGAAALRLHGIAERAQGAGHRAQARLAIRHHVDVVLPVAAHAEARRAIRHAALAGPAVHRACPQRQRRHRLFPDSRPSGWWRSGRR